MTESAIYVACTTSGFANYVTMSHAQRASFISMSHKKLCCLLVYWPAHSLSSANSMNLKIEVLCSHCELPRYFLYSWLSKLRSMDVIRCIKMFNLKWTQRTNAGCVAVWKISIQVLIALSQNGSIHADIPACRFSLRNWNEGEKQSLRNWTIILVQIKKACLIKTTSYVLKRGNVRQSIES